MSTSSNTHTGETEADLRAVLQRLDAGSALTMPVSTVIDALLDARALVISRALTEAIDEELAEISSRPSLVRAEEVVAIAERLTTKAGQGAEA